MKSNDITICDDNSFDLTVRNHYVFDNCVISDSFKHHEFFINYLEN